MTPKFIVLTGGPGAGKTAVLEVVRRLYCEHVVVLRESASIVFGGGFPRHPTTPGRQAAQRAIARVQQQLERMAVEEGHAKVVLCDRGTVDGAAYWPGDPDGFWGEIGVTRDAEVGRYDTVVHLRPPDASHGYNHANTVRVESAPEAHLIDARIAEVWARHPRRFFVETAEHFTEKLEQVLELLRAEIPPCCGRGRSALAAGAVVT